MFPGMNSRQAQQMMKKMGIAQQQIDAERVVIHCKDHIIVLDQPEVSKMNMMGQEMFQVAGEARTESVSKEVEISQEDIETVMSQTQVDEETAKEAIKNAEGDLAEAILALSKE